MKTEKYQRGCWLTYQSDWEKLKKKQIRSAGNDCNRERYNRVFENNNNNG